MSARRNFAVIAGWQPWPIQLLVWGSLGVFYVFLWKVGYPAIVRFQTVMIAFWKRHGVDLEDSWPYKTGKKPQ